LLSVIVPAFNERQTIAGIIVAISAALPDVPKEVIVVDDGSIDGTRDWLLANAGSAGTIWHMPLVAPNGDLAEHAAPDTRSPMTLRAIFHEKNRGKGGALRTGFAASTGDILIIQDADLEYDPQDWAVMYDLIAKRGVADVVYGSRFTACPHRALYFHHYMANRLISFVFNMLYNQMLSDIEVCYKMMSRAVLDSLALTCDDFGVEVQLSAQIARNRHWRIYEVGISYFGRTYDEGKKINWRDGLKALWYLVKFRFSRI
jgi:glycosyltransferase involved in cell wall biosynthesis